MTGDVRPNDTIEDKEPWGREKDINTIYFEIFYYTRLLPLRLANPDTVQFNTDDIRTNFGVIDQTYHTKSENGEDVLLLSADRYYEGGSEDRWNVYQMNNPSLEGIDD